MEKILLIDDEPNILNAFRRKLSAQYEVHVASSGSEGLTVMSHHTDISVIITDMQMPGMNGIDFLKELSIRNPDAMRIMLTGLADQKTVVRAINEGSIFKFLNKPCSVDELEQTIQEALVVKKLHSQEKELLQQTLSGTIKFATDIAALIDPKGFEQALKMKKVIHLIGKFCHINSSELELAPLFLGLGIIANDQRNTEQTFAMSAKLLKAIPRFNRISSLLETLASPHQSMSESLKNQVTIYHIAQKLSDYLEVDEPLIDCIEKNKAQLSPEEMNLLFKQKAKSSSPIEKNTEGYLVELKELCPGQMLMSDIIDQSGKLLLKSGFMLSKATIERVNTYQTLVGVQTPIRVSQRIPTKEIE